MADEELTVAERRLFEAAEAEALAGLRFDCEAGLADLLARASEAPPRLSLRASVPRSFVRVRVGVVALVALAAFGTTAGIQQVMIGAREELVEPPTLAVPSPSVIAPGRSRPARDPVAPLPSVTARPFGSASSDAPSLSPGSRSSASSSGIPSSASPARSPSSSPSSLPSSSPSSLPPSLPSSSPARPSPLLPPSHAAPATFRVRYPATLVTVPIDDTGPQSLDLAQPKIVDDGPVQISASPATGDSLLANDDNVRAAMIPAADVTPDDCADALRATPGPGSPLPLRTDRTYCLMTASPAEPQTLVRLNVEEPQQPGEITLRLKAWDAMP
ncbi:hypothetical protein Ade02nite_76810 [Paractinoplanes deccanensis]|uniref:Uncharacterized protein n=1 Tax=Paractinoplanes deccanensis TaxID=113561 RepID=A0ABQ3YGA0_9ACTN|nr:hypothetical protein [Actinoplanes deccanensis]GID79040.1 hypothetical protein Ade02nite_76810 [Actinoplanes deccanensis]